MLIEFSVPVYNEEKILKTNLLKLYNYLCSKNFGFDWRIVTVINGTSDNSVQIAKELQVQTNGKISYVDYKEPGRGLALKKNWHQSHADVLVYMDIDLAVSLNDIEDLIDPIIKNKADLVIGSRLLAASKIERSFIRELSSQSYNFISKIILGHKFSDLQCGFKAIKKEVFEKVEPQIKNKKWFFDTELIAFTNYYKFRVAEIPVDWSENRYEERKSKVNLLKDSLRFLLNLVKLKIRLITL